MSSNDVLSADAIPATLPTCEYSEEDNESDSWSEFDEPSPPVPVASTSSDAKNRWRYQCPDCCKTYLSISGFRGHVQRKHNKPYLKAQDHRVDGTGSGSHPQMMDVMDGSDMQDIAHAAITSMLQDPFLHLTPDGVSTQLLGEAILASDIASSAICQLLQPFVTAMKRSLLAGLYELLWAEYHRAVSDEKLVKEVKDSVIGLCYDINADRCAHFFSVTLFEAVARSTIQREEGKINVAFERSIADISSYDKSVLFYIAGYVIDCMLKRTKQDEDQLAVLQTLCVADNSCDAAPEVKAWLKAKDRGGLKMCSSSFFQLVQSWEAILRRNIDVHRLTKNSLASDNLREIILTDSVVQHLWRAAVGSSDHQFLLEQLLAHFLTVRGHAVAKLVQRKTQDLLQTKLKAKNSRTSSSLRKTLKRL